MVFIYGTRLMGKCEQVPGLFHVATKFAHFDYVPLIPTESWVVFSQNGKQFRGARIPMHAKSVFLTWGRFITFIAGIVGLIMAMVTFSKPGSSSIRACSRMASKTPWHRRFARPWRHRIASWSGCR